MSNKDINSTNNTDFIFRDPVAYLAGFGIEAEVVVDTVLPAAA